MAIQKLTDSCTPSLNTLVRIHRRVERIPAFFFGAGTATSAASAIAQPLEFKVGCLGVSAVLGTLGLLAFKVDSALQKTILSKAKKEYYILHRAIQEKNFDLMRLILQRTDTNIESENGFKQTPLHTAVLENQNAKPVRFLLDMGANPQACDIWGYTPLHYARTEEIARMLVEAGADLEVRDRTGAPPLYKMAEAGSTEAVRFLLDAGADPNAQDRTSRWAPLHTAAMHKDTAIVHLLLGAGADPNSPDVDGYTPIYFAKNSEIVQLLLNAGANLNVRNRGENTPLHYQVQNPIQNEEIIPLLIAAGADVNTKNSQGATPLHDAKSSAVAKMLIAAGADIEAKNGRERTPLHLAALFGKGDVFKALLDAGADAIRTRHTLIPFIRNQPAIEQIFTDYVKELRAKITEATNRPILPTPLPENLCNLIQAHVVDTEACPWRYGNPSPSTLILDQ